MTASLAAIEARRRSDAAPAETRAERSRSVVVLGKPTDTNCALVAAFGELGQRARLVPGNDVSPVARGDIALGRVDVLPTLDGIEPGLRQLSQLERLGARLEPPGRALRCPRQALDGALPRP